MYLGNDSDTDSAEFGSEPVAAKQSWKKVRKRQKKALRKQVSTAGTAQQKTTAKEEYKSKWDQFCDFTSLVGFRLLHSRNPRYLRLSSTAVMVLACLLISLQTRAAISRFSRLDSSTMTSVREEEDAEIEQPELLFCTTNPA
jgi:Flp pilus assembly protein TadB